LAQEFPDLLGRETCDEIIRPDLHTLLYDNSYGWISIVASRTQRELTSLATALSSEIAMSPIKLPAAKEAVGYGKMSKKGAQPQKDPSDPRLGTFKTCGDQLPSGQGVSRII
jgi:hypothetical protein